MIPVTAVVENKYSDSQRVESADIKSNMTTRVIRVPTKVDEEPEVFIDEYIDSKEEPVSLVDEVTFRDTDIDSTGMVEILYEEEEADTAFERRYPNRQIHKKKYMSRYSRGNGMKMITESC